MIWRAMATSVLPFEAFMQQGGLRLKTKVGDLLCVGNKAVPLTILRRERPRR
jgi:hypothetical protein